MHSAILSPTKDGSPSECKGLVALKALSLSSFSTEKNEIYRFPGAASGFPHAAQIPMSIGLGKTSATNSEPIADVLKGSAQRIERILGIVENRIL